MKIDMNDHWTHRNPILIFFQKFGANFSLTLVRVWKTKMSKSQGDRHEFLPKLFFFPERASKKKFFKPLKKILFFDLTPENLIWKFQISKFWLFFNFSVFLHLFLHISNPRQNLRHVLLLSSHLRLWISVKCNLPPKI